MECSHLIISSVVTVLRTMPTQLFYGMKREIPS
jgi:hypothetical protein